MLKKYRKVLSIAVTLCLALTLVAGSTVMSFAADKAIKTVKITGLPEFAAGGSIADADVTVEPAEGAITETVWKVWDPEEEEFVVVKDGTFDDKKVYEMEFQVKADQGYAFDEWEFYFTFSDELAYLEDTAPQITTYDDDDNEIHICEIGRFTARTEIAKVAAVTPEVKAGNTIDPLTVTCYDAAGNVLENAVSLVSKWYEVSDADAPEVSGKTFEAEKAYDVEGILTANDGFCFAKNAVTFVNGKEYEAMAFANPLKLDVYEEFTLISPLKYAEIKLPEIKAGEKIFNELDMVNGSEAFYVYADWYDVGGGSVKEDTFVAGKKYNMTVEIRAVQYQPLAEDFVFIIDGKEYTPDEVNVEDKYAYVTLDVEVPEAAATDVGGDTSPETGDESNLLPWYLIAALGLAAAAAARRTHRI